MTMDPISDMLVTIRNGLKARLLQVATPASNLKAEIPFTDPDVSLIRRYRALGGTYLTLSTDAHATKYLGYRMDVLEQLARDAGFTELTYFRKHRPILVPL